MGKVIYLTGAPATGKSTLCGHLEETVPDLLAYSYSKLLRDYVNRRNQSSIGETDIRQQSAMVVTRADVQAVDDWLINEVEAKRLSKHLIIDSHAVTKEQYGFRITAFTVDQLRLLAPDVLVCLYVDPETTISRIQSNPAGRPLPTEYEAALHTELQSSLATQYAFALGIPCYMMNSKVSLVELAANIRDVARLDQEANNSR